MTVCSSDSLKRKFFQGVGFPGKVCQDRRGITRTRKKPCEKRRPPKRYRFIALARTRNFPNSFQQRRSSRVLRSSSANKNIHDSLENHAHPPPTLDESSRERLLTNQKRLKSFSKRTGHKSEDQPTDFNYFTMTSVYFYRAVLQF